MAIRKRGPIINIFIRKDDGKEEKIACNTRNRYVPGFKAVMGVVVIVVGKRNVKVYGIKSYEE